MDATYCRFDDAAGSRRPPLRRHHVRPVAVDYGDHADVGGWHSGERGLANFRRVLGRRGTMPVTIRLLDPLPPDDDRKALARHARRSDCRRPFPARRTPL